MLVTPAFQLYIASYSLACLLAAALMIRERKSLVLLQAEYRRFLTARWKLITFVIAACSMTVVAPYTGDPTWDYVDAAFMSILTFLTAPWSVGTLFLALRQRAKLTHVYIALCVWMFSVSWTYDVYILLKHGYYPATWAPNIVLSSILYLAAGMMWNLQKKTGRGVIFGFMERGWPDSSLELGFRQIVWLALPFMLLATAMIAPFLIP
ncbi:MAG: hypothetical protein O3A13_11530 [Proteobacteria bacterium]|nr:hypothetical protein [Pseudomonadota bacterium]MDA0994242.1 hypothetical protein [Pseudomonadota bacterium]